MLPARRAALACFLLAATALPAFAAGEPSAAERGRITLFGEGTASAVPDTATVSIGTLSTAKTAREAMDANTKAMTAVIETLKKAGIEARDLATDGFSVQPRYTYPKPGPNPEAPRLDGYEVRNQVTVRVRDLGKLGAVLDAAVTSGSNQIGGIAFTVAEPAALLDKARAAAVADARRKATVYAEAAGVKLGRVLDISEPGADMAPRPMMMARSADFAKAEAAPVPIEAGEQSFKVRVKMTWDVAE